jgi:hypothetical protein
MRPSALPFWAPRGSERNGVGGLLLANNAVVRRPPHMRRANPIVRGTGDHVGPGDPDVAKTHVRDDVSQLQMRSSRGGGIFPLQEHQIQGAAMRSVSRQRSG